MPEPLLLMLIAGAGAVIEMTVLWLIQRKTNNAGVVDVGWAAGLGAAAVLYAFIGEGDLTRRILIGVIGGFWGLRLALHLAFDRVIGHPEEGRYQQLREDWGDKTQRNLFIFFQAQALLVMILSLPFALIASDETPAFTILDIVGALMFLVGIGGVWLADYQLSRFKKDPSNKGKVCQEGLWRYSRHPNYFFEWIIWLSWGVIALGAPWGWIGLSAPALILFFILKVTGIPPTEKRALKSRGEAYREYQRTTSPFIPLPPKKKALT